MTSELRRRWRGCEYALALALVVAGCSDHGSKPLATQPAPQPGFAADSPANAVRLLEWSLEHRDLERFKGLITDDFLFVCAAADPAGSAFQGSVLTRLDEIETARSLLVGGGAHPPATSFSLQFDRNLIPQPDSRPGKDPDTHQEIVTSIVLRIETSEESFQVTGAARFFLVRGDAALLPSGVGPDPARWYIERWEDETAGSGVAPGGAGDERREASLRTQPAKMTSWCAIKALYR